MNLDVTLTQLETAQLVRRVGEEEAMYMFKHALTQDAAYQSLLKQTRRAIHHNVAETIEQIYADQLDEYAALLARHYGVAGDDAKTVEFAIRAGENATRLFAYPEARIHYATALNTLEHLPLNADLARRRIDLWLKYVEVALRLDGPERALESLAQAEQLFINIPASETIEDRTRRARLAYWRGDAHLHKSQPREAVKYMQQVLEIVESGLNDDTLAAIPSNVMGRALAVQGQFARAQPLLARATHALEKTSNWYEWVLAKGFLALALAMRGEIDAALAQTASALSRARELGTTMGVADSYALQAMALMQAGQYPEALESTRASFEQAQQMGDHLVMYIALSWRGWAETRLGAHENARASFSQARQISAETGGQLVFADWFATAEAELEFVSGTPDNALNRAQEALQFAQTIGGSYAMALAHRVCGYALAKQGQFDAAFEHWRECLRLFDEGDARLEAARTHFVWGKLLIERNDRESAKTHLEQAAAQFELSGLTRELNEARALLSAEKS